MKKSFIIAFILCLGIGNLSYAQRPQISEEVKENIKARVNDGINVGIVVGVITSEGVSYFSYGLKSLDTKESVDENSVFEIGSISKTFTGILLANMSLNGVLNVNDPIQSLLPEGITAPTRNGASIHFVHLSNHTSSLPRLPENMRPTNPSNPYADYSKNQLFDFLNTYQLPRDIGSQYEYSNYAVGLLGELLASKENTTYEDFMVQVIANPLGMKSTRITFSPQMKQNLAMGHNRGIQVQNWDLPTLAGAGGIRSTAVDMLKYLGANMGLTKTSLLPAMELAHKNSGAAESDPVVGLGWFINRRDTLDIISHGGGTGGYRTYAGFINGGDKGVVVLTNSSTGIEDIGLHILDPEYPLSTPTPYISNVLRPIIESEGIDKAINTYHDLKKTKSDTYDFSEDQLNNLGYDYLAKDAVETAIAIFKLNVEAYPNSYNVYDSYAEGLMRNNENEKAIENYKKSVELNPGNTNGFEQLTKLGVAINTLKKDVVVDDAILQRYVGNYELAPSFVIEISKVGSQLKAKPTGQGQVDIFPKSDTVFYLKIVQAQVTFNLDENGGVESMTLLQGGQESTGKKID